MYGEHPPTAVALLLWWLGDRRIQGPGAAGSHPSGSCQPGAAPCRARDPAAAPSPDRVPVGVESVGLRGNLDKR